MKYTINAELEKHNEQRTVASPIKPVVMWVSVDDSLPDEPKNHVQKWVDVWTNNGRLTNVNFFDGKFHDVIEDDQGDFDSYTEIYSVTHWMIIEEPST